MAIDEAQLYQVNSWVQLAPALNSWQQNTQLFFTGVPSGLRTSLLYYADKKLSGFKTYVIPAHNNPYYTQEDDIDNIKRYGGRETDDYVQLVCGGHGKAAYSVITRDQIEQLPYDFYRIVYTNEHMKAGMHYTALDTPNLSEYDQLAVGMDCGYVDPSIISILGFKGGRWYVALRYVLKRIDFETQKQFLHHLMKVYRFSRIGIDAASGGGGMQIIHALLNHPDFTAIDYRDIVVPVMFSERIPVGYDTDGKEMTVTTKTFGANLLVQQLQQKEIVLSEVDYELVSELERMTKQRGVSGMDTYYILSEKGNGAATEDHNFASMICFCVATRDMSFQKKRRKKLGRTGGKF
jgi:hypothetical protein